MKQIKDKLKQIATETAQKSGVGAVTFRELGKAVGIKSSSVVYHFENKDGLLYEIVTDYRDSFFQEINNIDNKFNTADQKLAALTDIFLSVVVEGKFCLCGMLASDANALDDKTRQFVRGFFNELEQWVTEVIASHASLNNALAPGLAQIIVSGLEGAMLLDKTDGTTARLTAMKGWIASLTP